MESHRRHLDDDSIVKISDLSRSPGQVLARIERGERLLVCRHGRPLATLQPLDGVVVQPFTGGAHDVFGWPAGGGKAETEKLSEAQKSLLTLGVLRRVRVHPTRLWGRFDPGELRRSLDQMRVLGIAKKTRRGWELTGRGLALRETLVAGTGVDPDDV